MLYHDMIHYNIRCCLRRRPHRRCATIAGVVTGGRHLITTNTTTNNSNALYNHVNMNSTNRIRHSLYAWVLLWGS